MRFALRRLAGALVVLVLVSILSFLLMRVLPGDPARMMLGPLAGEEAVAEVRRTMGLHLSLVDQYWRYITALLGGDWGFAIHTGRKVTTEIAARLPATAELAVAAILVTVGLVLLLGILAVAFQDTAIDRVIRAVALSGLGMPPFWFGLLLLTVFFFYLGLVPAPLGRLSPATFAPPKVTGFMTVDAALAGDWPVLWEALHHMVLPVATMCFALFPYLFRVLRASLLEVLRQPYVTTAAAKGAGPWRRIALHALPNAALPALTASGMAFGELLAGSVLIEKVFLWPGVGNFVTESVLAKDFAAVQAVILLSAVAYITVNLIVDLLYVVLNPRVRAS